MTAEQAQLNTESCDLIHSIIFSKMSAALLSGDWERATALQDLDVSWRLILTPAPTDRQMFGLPIPTGTDLRRLLWCSQDVLDTDISKGPRSWPKQ